MRTNKSNRIIAQIFMGRNNQSKYIKLVYQVVIVKKNIIFCMIKIMKIFQKSTFSKIKIIVGCLLIIKRTNRFQTRCKIANHKIKV